MSARLYAILARSSPRAVVFRRGPSKQVLLIAWDTAADTFDEGQWLKGRIYERRCDLSPDGSLLVYFGGNQKLPYRTWTAVSRPPYFTALALWPKGDAWGGGGHFATAREILLNHRPDEMDLADGFSIPKWLTVRPFGAHSGWGEDNPVWFERLSRDGWTCTSAGRESGYDRDGKVLLSFDPPIIWEKSNRRFMLQMKILGMKEREGPWYVCEHAVVDSSTGRTFEIGRTDWADWDRSGDLVFAADGCLYRARDDFDNPKLIADFNDRKFVNRKALADFLCWPGRGL